MDDSSSGRNLTAADKQEFNELFGQALRERDWKSVAQLTKFGFQEAPSPSISPAVYILPVFIAAMWFGLDVLVGPTAAWTAAAVCFLAFIITAPTRFRRRLAKQKLEERADEQTARNG